MTNKERFEQIEAKVIANSNAITDMRCEHRALVKEWVVYENKYKGYIRKRNRCRKFLWWLFCKVTFRNTKLTEIELNKYVAKKMARIFYKGN